MIETVSIERKDTVQVFGVGVKYVGTICKDGVVYRGICIYPPWLPGDHVCEDLTPGREISSFHQNDFFESVKVTLVSGESDEIMVSVVRSQFQYELIFDVTDSRLGHNKSLLEAEYAKFEAAGWREVTHEDPDCFPLVALHGGGVDETPHDVWLCQAVEYGKSPCAPLPYWLCPWPSAEKTYFRGECDCDDFRERLQPLGIPCCHLIAALKWYAGTPAYCQYVECPP